MTDSAAREAWCQRLLERLSAAIAREAPEGIGRWDEAWQRVDRPSRELLLELRRIERGGGDPERAKRLGMDVLTAWRYAGGEWRTRQQAA